MSLKRTRGTFDFGPSAQAAAIVAKMVLEKGIPARTLLNINVPTGTPKGLRVTTQAKRNHVTQIDARTDPRGNDYYWIEEALDEYHPDSGKTDYEAVMAGYTSVTPLQPDMTAYDAIKRDLEEHLERRVYSKPSAQRMPPLMWARKTGSFDQMSSRCPSDV